MEVSTICFIFADTAFLLSAADFSNRLSETFSNVPNYNYFNQEKEHANVFGCPYNDYWFY